MNRCLPLACTLLLGSALADSLEGTYHVTRTLSGGRQEQGTLRITAAGKALSFDWDGGKVTGLGLRLGDRVAVAYGNPDCGVAAYQQTGGTFTGLWTLSGQATGTETFNWDGLKPARVPLSGRNPDGSTYSGELLLPLQDGHSLPQWRIGQDKTAGAALLQNGFLATAFGSETCNVALFEVRAGPGELGGRFFTLSRGGPAWVAEVASRR
ncbi:MULTISPECIES: hypothetical protein [Deinococcus]|jgi:hypothetical protein|uniref:Uncharacterized protein n=2 Tax=Deinococcus soli (ex Cha et al. 2016) TaxID=1309411 RepID=A0A0F7JK68_9DEIO|nr:MULTISPECIES: hypothetical protein [Deinococcus]AKH16556.1 hypothetical protein SY84_05215 [Deinococcus soli (ex Cha et al. 2016)]MDK2011080.1 hypothetical protein [Deinococcus sp. 43]MDR6217035.1 hypothetical protein [Deinococcus soli (ex Cha et al. 2016)]MDR6327856.1 hypothetical protein [Deinococcus soli (ex Cha et al. 2016)]MDR6750131.1 hypothetical protein [Deinococcus soli (ex Cha et al. 2016)]